MIKKLQDWIEGIFEDDAIPEEITTIVFNIVENGKFKYLELKGYEGCIDANKISFFPLEAQFFCCKDLLINEDNLFLYRIKTSIEEAFSSATLEYLLKNRKVYLKYNQNINYLFTV